MDNEKVSYEDFFGEMERYFGERKKRGLSEKLDIYLKGEKMSVKVECKKLHKTNDIGDDGKLVQRVADTILIYGIRNNVKTDLTEKNVISIGKSGNKYIILKEEYGQKNAFGFDLNLL